MEASREKILTVGSSSEKSQLVLTPLHLPHSGWEEARQGKSQELALLLRLPYRHLTTRQGGRGGEEGEAGHTPAHPTSARICTNPCSDVAAGASLAASLADTHGKEGMAMGNSGLESTQVRQVLSSWLELASCTDCRAAPQGREKQWS